MQVKEEYVPIEKAEKVFEVIKKALNKNKDIQVFVAEELIKELLRYPAKHHAYIINAMGSVHYNKASNDVRTAETWLMYTKGSFYDQVICTASFIANCKGYYQLVELPNKKYPKAYIHYCVGFEELLVIEVGTN